MVTRQQIMMFKHSADQIYSLGDYTSATILYFKTWFALQDYALLEKTGSSPKDHSERFRMLQKEFPDMYQEVDKEFSMYRDTYSKVIPKQECDRIKRIIEHALQSHHIG